MSTQLPRRKPSANVRQADSKGGKANLTTARKAESVKRSSALAVGAGVRKGESKVMPKSSDTSKISAKNKKSSGQQPRTAISKSHAAPPNSNCAPPSEDLKLSGHGVSDDLFDLIGKALTEFPWYHGLMPRQDCEELLVKEGDFVVRRTKKKGASLFCISAKAAKEHTHIPLNYKDGKWTLFGWSCGTLNELIDLLVSGKKALGKTAVVLKEGIHRPDFYILHENIITETKIGAGAFGEVFTGVLRLKDNKEVKVAVKKAKGHVSKKQLNQFVKEAMTMRRICHFNCIRLYGVAPQEEPFMIVLELAAGGSLKTFFKKNPDCSVDQQISFLKDAARGMCYLSACQVIHRDLAARNCLLNDQKVLKISDFGLSVTDTPELKLKQLKAVPVKWLSPETLTQGIFNAKTDVWSYGVLTWEVFAKCKTDPFPNDTNAQAKEKILTMPKPMDPPPGSPPLVKSILDACFVKDPANRLDFPGVLSIVAPGETPPTGN